MLRWGFCVSVFSSRRCQKHRTYRQRNYLGTACGSTSIVWEELHAGVSLGFDCQCCCGHLVFSSIPSSFLQYFARLLNYSCFQYLFFQITLESFAELLRKFHQYYTRTSGKKTVILLDLISRNIFSLLCKWIIQCVNFTAFYFWNYFISLNRIIFLNYFTNIFLQVWLIWFWYIKMFCQLFQACYYQCVVKHFCIYLALHHLAFLRFLRLIWYSVQFGRSVMSDSLWPHGSQHAGPPCPSPTPGVHLDSCPLR